MAAPQALAFAIPNAAQRTATGRASNAIAGLLVGAPDLLLIQDGRAFFVELKAGKGRLSLAQCMTHERLRSLGARVEICRSLNDVARALEAWGLPCRTKLA
ncbi:MAG: VRR-NUC domain-containing protein [Caulobacterales bacterium]